MTLDLRKATRDDFRDYYKIKCCRENVKWGGFSSPPDEKKLHTVYLDRISNPLVEIFFGELDGRVVGFSMAVKTNSIVRMSVALYDHEAGKGVGRTLIRKTALCMRKSYPGKPIRAWIVPENMASIIAHRTAGYRPAKDRQRENIHMSLVDKESYQLCWEFKERT